MKKVILLLFTCIALASSTAQAQSSVIKVNLLSPIVRTGSVFYERSIAADKSLQLGGFYTGFSVEETKFKGYGITPEFRKYFSTGKEAPEGFYVAPFARFQSFKLELDSEEASTPEGKATFNTIGGGVLVGRQWVFSNRIVLDAFLGPSYNTGNVKVTSGDAEDFETGAFSGFGIRTGLALGIKF